MSLTAALPGGLLLRGQEKDGTFSAGVSVVNLLVSVRDKKGAIVTTLASDDFTVSEDGRGQTIRYFSRESDLPLTIGLLVDTSLSQREVLAQERSASFRFLDRVLRADKDKTFVMHFDHESELLQDLTSSRTDLQHALNQLDLPAGQRGRPNQSRNGGPGGMTLPGGIGFPGGGRRGGGGGRRGQGGTGTVLYDAIFLGCDEIMRKQTGRKALILLTDGVDNGSKTFLSNAIESAQRADTLVYSILFSDEQNRQQPLVMGRRGGGRGAGGETRDGKKVLEQISAETGGTFFEVSKKLTIDDIYTKIQEELRNQYSLGYVSDSTNATGFRAIRVTVKLPNLNVRTRSGYYPTAHT